MPNGQDPDSSVSEQTFKTNVQVLWANTLWALKLTWSTSAPLVSGVVLFTLLRGFMPAGLALAARGLINVLIGVLNRKADDFGVLVPWLILGFGLAIVQAVTELASRYLMQRLTDELNLKLNSDILTHAARLDFAFFEDPRLHDIMERARHNTAQHFSQFLTSILGAFNGALQVISLMAILVVIEPLIVLVLGVVILPYLVYQFRLAKMRYLIERSRTTKRRWTQYFVRLLTSPQSAAEVKLLDLASLLIDRYRSLMAEFRIQDHQLHRRSFRGGSLFAVVSTTAFYGTLVWVAFRAFKGGLTVGDVAIYAGAAAALRGSLTSAILSVASAVEQTLYVSSLAEFLSITPRIHSAAGRVPASSRGEIEFRNVSFTYPGSPRPALSDVSFHIKPGETVALVGENGAGKTTLVKLIARLYDPDTGCITLDGIDLRELLLTYLHSQISFVFQNFGRYEATVAHNIAYGDWRRLMHDRQLVEEIGREAKVEDLIEKMPQAYDTMLGRTFGEFELSDGQWQRIAMTRASARQTPVLILDEPTASLDVRAEYEVFSRFRELSRGRSTILISHRFSTVSMADRILVLDEGRIIESGTHQELLALNGHYATLYNLHKRQMASLPEG